MKEIKVIGIDSVVHTLIAPALFKITCDIRDNDTSIFGGSQEKKDETTFELFRNKNGGYVLSCNSDKDGLSLIKSDDIANLRFPAPLFNVPEFVGFLKANNGDKSTVNYIFQQDASAKLYLLADDTNSRIFADRAPLALKYKSINGRISIFVLFDLDEQIGLLTDVFKESHELELISVDKTEFDHDTLLDGGDDLLAAILKMKNFVEQKEPPRVSDMDCYLNHKDFEQLDPTIIVSPQSETSVYHVKIYGDIFAEYEYKENGAPKSIVICYSSPTVHGVGLVMFLADNKGVMRYFNKYEVFMCYGQPHVQGSPVAEKFINKSVAQVLQNNGVAEPEKYIGLLCNKPVDLQDVRPLLNGQLYGKELLQFSTGRCERVIMVEQYGSLVAYKVVNNRGKSIRAISGNTLYKILNKMTITGGNNGVFAAKAIDLLCQYNSVKQAA